VCVNPISDSNQLAQVDDWPPKAVGEWSGTITMMLPDTAGRSFAIREPGPTACDRLPSVQSGQRKLTRHGQIGLATIDYPGSLRAGHRPGLYDKTIFSSARQFVIDAISLIQRKLLATVILSLTEILTLFPHPALCWGDKGPEVIALLADRYLDPRVRSRINEMLTNDPDTLTAHDIASEATWADKYKGPPGDQENGCATCEWHFVNIEIHRPNIDEACFAHPELALNTLASQGPARDCIVDKIDQFTKELANPATAPVERLLAVKFLLHLVGDLHQPLHVADDHDAGGNLKRVSAPGFPDGSLHFFWDVPFVEKLGGDPQHVAALLAAQITPCQQRLWSKGTVLDWMWESFKIGRDHAYGMLISANEAGVSRLQRSYVRTALGDVALQLSKSGVRLAYTLNRALAPENRRASHSPTR
jgi:hypothetical protein